MKFIQINKFLVTSGLLAALAGAGCGSDASQPKTDAALGSDSTDTADSTDVSSTDATAGTDAAAGTDTVAVTDATASDDAAGSDDSGGAVDTGDGQLADTQPDPDTTDDAASTDTDGWQVDTGNDVPPTDVQGGGSCANNSQCPSGLFFCQRDTGYCALIGQCVLKPQGCPEIFQPVCGCNGQDYSNACEAHAAGVSVASAGTCDAPLGCEDNGECPKGQFCSKPAGSCNAMGKCSKYPDFCGRALDPVCGCDGKDWPSPCVAALSGVNVSKPGKCNE